MKQDTVLEELRKIRREIEAETNNNPSQYYAYLLTIQEKYKDRIVQDTKTPAASNRNATYG